MRKIHLRTKHYRATQPSVKAPMMEIVVEAPVVEAPEVKETVATKVKKAIKRAVKKK